MHKKKNEKKYTPVRKFYAWVGFIGMALTVPAIIFLLTKVLPAIL
jgi:hypothetical protein